MHSRDIESIFSMLMVSLDLKEEGVRQSGFFSKSCPFSFTFDEAVTHMKSLEVVIVSSATTTTITCGIPSPAAEAFLVQLMNIKLIHCPTDRTRHDPKPSVVMQPTAKGIHIMQRYCSRNGIRATEAMNSLWRSEYNTMKCVALDRHPSSDVLLRSDAFIYLLFQHFTGPQPNIYDAYEFGDRKSPYSHRYFDHPESDAISQYYSTREGARMLKERHVYGKTYRNVITGRSCWQWLMECTDAMHTHEAVTLANMFISHGLMETITYNDEFNSTRGSLYQITTKGYRLSQWKLKRPPELKVSTSGLEIDNLSPVAARFSREQSLSDTSIPLQHILDDAGLRALFREHLAQEFCEENLLLFMELNSLFSLSDHSKVEKLRMAEGDLISMAYGIYNRFLAPGSANEININHDLRSHLLKVLISEKITTEEKLREQLMPLYEQLLKDVYKMMQYDSLPKFLTSAEYSKKVRAIAPWLFEKKRKKIES